MRSIFSSIAVIVVMLLLDCPCMAGDDAIIYFTPQNFTFAIKVADDGTGPAGGWQEAKSGLIFGPTPSGGTVCVAVIGMPLRNSAWGKISTSVAPTYLKGSERGSRGTQEKRIFQPTSWYLLLNIRKRDG